MKFSNNKTTNFIYDGNLKECSVSIGTNVRDKKNELLHPIEKAIQEAEKFVYIISPYISESMINKLIEKENENIDIKLLCSCKTSSGIIENRYLKIFEKFIFYRTFTRRETAKKECEKKYDMTEYIELRDEYYNKIDNIKGWSKFFFYLIYLIPLFLVGYGFFNDFSKKVLNLVGLIFIVLVILWFLLKIKEFKIRKNLNKVFNKISSLQKEKIGEMNKIKIIPPEVKWRNINFKVAKNLYNKFKNTSNVDTPLIHTKLYIMDCPSLISESEEKNKAGIVAFLGSVNFTYPAFHENYEFLLKTTDREFVEKLLKYFNNLYNSNEISSLTKEEIYQELKDGKIFSDI